MASILDQYGIKEVADVVFYELDSKGAPSAPVLYLDTLKVSTVEQSAEVVDATGGKGNVKLISWDTNKEVTATFEDALCILKLNCQPSSMNISIVFFFLGLKSMSTILVGKLAFGIVVVGRGQAQEMGVRVAAHIGLNIGSHHMPLISHIICREAVDDTKDQIQERQLRHDFQCKRFQALHAGIRQIAYDHRESQLRQAGKACAGQILCDRCFVFTVIGQKTPHEFSA